MHTLYVVDGSSFIYRAHHAIKEPMTNDKGFPTGALYGYVKMILSFIKHTTPIYMVVVFDTPGGNFRHKLFPAYKANRPTIPSEALVRQMPFFDEITTALGIHVIKHQGVEADDVIGTLATRFQNDMLITILGADKDLMQLISSRVVMVDTMRGIRFGIKDVIKKFEGVGPEHVIDVLGLAGDSGDNVPGVPGIGVKTAAKLVQEFGTVEDILANIDKVSGKKRKQMLADYADIARLSKELVTLKLDVPVDVTPQQMCVGKRDRSELRRLFTEFNFKPLLGDALR